MADGYTVKFDRIGRTHDVPDLDVPSTDADEIADAVYEYARPRLLSRDVGVWVDMEKLTGGIVCGFNNGGSFTLAVSHG